MRRTLIITRLCKLKQHSHAVSHTFDNIIHHRVACGESNDHPVVLEVLAQIRIMKNSQASGLYLLCQLGPARVMKNKRTFGKQCLVVSATMHHHTQRSALHSSPSFMISEQL